MILENGNVCCMYVKSTVNFIFEHTLNINSLLRREEITSNGFHLGTRPFEIHTRNIETHISYFIIARLRTKQANRILLFYPI